MFRICPPMFQDRWVSRGSELSIEIPHWNSWHVHECVQVRVHGSRCWASPSHNWRPNAQYPCRIDILPLGPLGSRIFTTYLTSLPMISEDTATAVAHTSLFLRGSITKITSKFEMGVSNPNQIGTDTLLDDRVSVIMLIPASASLVASSPTQAAHKIPCPLTSLPCLSIGEASKFRMDDSTRPNTIFGACSPRKLEVCAAKMTDAHGQNHQEIPVNFQQPTSSF